MVPQNDVIFKISGENPVPVWLELIFLAKPPNYSTWDTI